MNKILIPRQCEWTSLQSLRCQNRETKCQREAWLCAEHRVEQGETMRIVEEFELVCMPNGPWIGSQVLESEALKAQRGSLEDSRPMADHFQTFLHLPVGPTPTSQDF